MHQLDAVIHSAEDNHIYFLPATVLNGEGGS